MRQLERERRGVWFAKFASKEKVFDEDGNFTGEWRIVYGKPELIRPTVSPNAGNTWADGFGMGVSMDRSMIIDRIGLGIDETCICWVDVRPRLDSDGNLVLDDDGLPVVPNDYTVSTVAESYNFTNVALKKAM